MQIEEIEILITPDGKVELAVHGVKGLACLDITRDLETALGNAVLVREMTLESSEEAGPNVPTGDQQINLKSSS
jgi:hypothetical protein